MMSSTSIRHLIQIRIRGRLPRPYAFAAPALLLVVAAGCNGDGGGGGGSAPIPITSAACTDPTAKITVTDETNYSLSNSFTLEHSTVKDATDLNFDWSGLTKDFFGKSVDAANDVDLVLISLWRLTPEQIRDALKDDNLPLSSMAGAMMDYPDGTYTSQNLLDFGLLGNPLPTSELWARFDTSTPNYQYPQDQYTFLLMASSGTEAGKHARMMSLFNIDPNSTNTNLALTDSSTKLDYTVNLTNARPVRVPAGIPALTIDWGQMTLNSIGNEYIPQQITEVAVAHYSSRTIAQLETEFLNLEEIADGWWSGPVPSGVSIDLSTLKDASGSTFPGIDANGVWIAAMFCTANCNNPAPWSIAILQPCN